MGQEECPLSLTENLPLFRINSKRIKKDWNHWKQGHSDSILLLTSNKRINWIKGNMESAEIDWSRFDTEEAVRGLNKKEREMRLDEISTIINLQGKINELKTTLEIIKRQREEDNDRLCRERYQKNKKEREERKEQKRVNEKWEKIEKIRIKEERKAVREWKQ